MAWPPRRCARCTACNAWSTWRAGHARASRAPHAHAGRAGARRPYRHRDAEGCDERALRDWIANVADTYYLLGTGAGPHPYPWLVREFRRRDARADPGRTGRLPDAMVACVGGGSNALGFFYPFLGDAGVRMIGVEAGGLGLASGAHAASLGPAAPACCTAATAITCRTRTARSSTRIRSRRAWTTRAWGRNMRCCTTASA